jgi:putative FmdB family regulatory protein
MPIFEYVCRQCNHQFEAIVMANKKPPALNVRANS